jgi:hypothetical protein
VESAKNESLMCVLKLPISKSEVKGLGDFWWVFLIITCVLVVLSVILTIIMSNYSRKTKNSESDIIQEGFTFFIFFILFNFYYFRVNELYNNEEVEDQQEFLIFFLFFNKLYYLKIRRKSW